MEEKEADEKLRNTIIEEAVAQKLRELQGAVPVPVPATSAETCPEEDVYASLLQ